MRVVLVTVLSLQCRIPVHKSAFSEAPCIFHTFLRISVIKFVYAVKKSLCFSICSTGCGSESRTMFSHSLLERQAHLPLCRKFVSLSINFLKVKN